MAALADGSLTDAYYKQVLCWRVWVLGEQAIDSLRNGGIGSTDPIHRQRAGITPRPEAACRTRLSRKRLSLLRV